MARKLFDEEEAPRIPNGVVIRGNADINVGYSWHIDSDTIEFADVEKGLITSARYCP